MSRFSHRSNFLLNLADQMSSEETESNCKIIHKPKTVASSKRRVNFESEVGIKVCRATNVSAYSACKGIW